MTRKEVAGLVAALTAAFPRAEIGENTVRVYIDMLADLDFDEAQAAVKKLMATSTFFPSIAEIRQAVADLRTRHLPEPEEAWEEVMRELRRVGGYLDIYGPLQFSCEEVRRAVKAIGWQTLCMSESIGVERAHFLRIYDTFRRRTKEDANLGPLLGAPRKEGPAAIGEIVAAGALPEPKREGGAA